MYSILKQKVADQKIPHDKIQIMYRRFRIQALLGVFIGYFAYYIVRNNFAFSTPYLMQHLKLSTTQIGLLSSCMLISYGISKGLMSSLADKANPKAYMAFGLILCAIVNIGLGFSAAFWIFALFVILNGFFQGMGIAPTFITITNWFPTAERGRVTSIWTISHNIGGGIVAPIIGGAMALFGTEYWQFSSYLLPAIIAIIIAIIAFIIGKGSPVSEGLPELKNIVPEKMRITKLNVHNDSSNMTTFNIFTKYALKNKHVWYITFVDVFVYMIRFGIISWLPIYLLIEKKFSKGEMGAAFLFFEWAAIPSTLLAGIISDKLFKGRPMPLAIICLCLIFVCIIGYWKSDSVLMLTVFATIVGCFIFVPQLLASVQTLDIVPPFAIGSAVGLRGFMSYIFGASLGTSLFGILVDNYGWDAGFYLLMGGTICGIFFCILSHRGIKEIELKRKQSHEAAGSEGFPGSVAKTGSVAEIN